MRFYKLMPVFYTHFLLSKGAKGTFRGFFAVLDPIYRLDKGLHEHEWTHFKQSMRLLVVGHTFLTLLSKRYRQYSEVQAFRAEIAINPERLDTSARALATAYGFNLTVDQARALLAG